MGRRRPFIRRLLPTIHSQVFLSIRRSCIRVVLFQSFAAFPFGHRGSPPTVHSQAITNHSFAGFSTSHSQIMHSRHLFQSFAPFPLVITGRRRPFIHRLLPTIHSQVMLSRHLFQSFAPFPFGHRGSPPTVHSQAIANHSFAGFLPAIRRSFVHIICFNRSHLLLLVITGCRRPFTHRLLPALHSHAIANPSFTGYCQPSIHRLSTIHSQVSTGHLRVITSHSFTSFCVIHSHLFLLVIVGRHRLFIRTLFPTNHSQVFYQPFADHSFMSFCFSHSHLSPFGHCR